MRGRFLLVTGVLLVIDGAIGVVAGAAMLLGADALAGMTSGSGLFAVDGVEDVRSFIVLSAVLSIGHSLFEGVVGVAGVRAARGAARKETCQVLAIALVGVAAVSSLAMGLSSSFDLGTLLSFAMSIVLPVLFFVAARRAATKSFWRGIKYEEEPKRDADDAAALAEYSSAAPLRYRLLAGLIEPLGAEAPGDGACVEIVAPGQAAAYDAAFLSVPERSSSIRHCHAGVVASAVGGTLAFPFEEVADRLPGMPHRFVTASFRLESDRLVFVTDDSLFSALFAQFVQQGQLTQKESVPAMLLEFLEFVMRDDSLRLDDREERLDRLEENMAEDVNEIPKDFDEFVMDSRLALRSLVRFYKQYADLCQNIAASPVTVLAGEERSLYRALADRARRLADDAQDLFDYALQIKGLYQAKIDVRQNKVMQLLTVVTTVFMPLTLITGWYGMNFDLMPELHFRLSYFVVIALAILVVTVEVVVFKRKKWL